MRFNPSWPVNLLRSACRETLSKFNNQCSGIKGTVSFDKDGLIDEVSNLRKAPGAKVCEM